METVDKLQNNLKADSGRYYTGCKFHLFKYENNFYISKNKDCLDEQFGQKYTNKIGVMETVIVDHTASQDSRYLIAFKQTNDGMIFHRNI